VGKSGVKATIIFDDDDSVPATGMRSSQRLVRACRDAKCQVTIRLHGEAWDDKNPAIKTFPKVAHISSFKARQEDEDEDAWTVERNCGALIHSPRCWLMLRKWMLRKVTLCGYHE
jgi:hypothetical protein